MGKHAVSILTFLAFIMYTVNFSNYAPLAPGIVATMGLSYTQSGLILALNSIVQAIFLMPMGILSDRWGGRRVLFFGLLMLGLSVISFPLSGSYGMILVTRVILGIGGASVITSCVKLISAVYPPETQDRAIGIWGMGWGCGFLLTFLFMPVIEAVAGWEMGFYASGIATLLVLAVSLPFLKGGTAMAPSLKLDTETVRRVLSGNFFPAVGVRFTAIFVTVGALAWIPFYLKEAFLVSPISIGYVGALFGVMTIPASAAGGIVSNRWKKKPVILIAMVMCTLSSFLIVHSPSLGLAVLSVAVLGWGTMFWAAPTIAIINADAGRSVGFRYGLFNSIGFTGSFLAPVLMGYALDVTGSYPVAFAVLGGGAALLGIGGAILLRER